MDKATESKIPSIIIDAPSSPTPAKPASQAIDTSKLAAPAPAKQLGQVKELQIAMSKSGNAQSALSLWQNFIRTPNRQITTDKLIDLLQVARWLHGYPKTKQDFNQELKLAYNEVIAKYLSNPKCATASPRQLIDSLLEFADNTDRFNLVNECLKNSTIAAPCRSVKILLLTIQNPQQQEVVVKTWSENQHTSSKEVNDLYAIMPKLKKPEETPSPRVSGASSEARKSDTSRETKQ